MPTFPVISSNLSPYHLSLFVREKYNLSNHSTCVLLKAGINHTYLIKDGELKLIFRVYSYNWRTESEILEEIKLLNLLKSNGISISYPILDISDKYLQTIEAPEGKRFALMLSYAEGEKLLNYAEELHFEVGVLMAKIHQTSINISLKRIDYHAQSLIGKIFDYLPTFLSENSEEMNFMRSTQAYLWKEFDKIDDSQLRKGAVHLDIWFDNLNISRNGEITIFDFDFCGNGWLCLDIAYYVLQLYSTEKDISICESKVKSFLAGYETITPISAEEQRILPMLGISLYFFYLTIQCQRFDNWSNTFLNEMYLKRFINLLIKRYFDLNTSSID